MAVFIVASQKGGTGKSTTAISVALYNSEFGQGRTLFIPLDNQGGNAKRTFKIPANLRQVNGMFHNEEYDIHVVNDKLHTLSSDRTIHNLDRTEFEHALNFAAEVKNLKKQYDHIVIDTPPGLGSRITAAVIAADHIIVPIECEESSVEGMVELRDTIQKLARYNTAARINSIVINKFNHTVEQKQILDVLMEHFSDVIIEPIIGDLQPVRTAGAAGRAVWHKARNGNHREAAKIMKTVISRIVEKVL